MTRKVHEMEHQHEFLNFEVSLWFFNLKKKFLEFLTGKNYNFVATGAAVWGNELLYSWLDLAQLCLDSLF